ncbi:MAG: sugar ABC transporter ATP-binding protein, partial [Mesorhizobium sp.]
MNYSDASIGASTIAPFLSLEAVRKTYPGVVALDGFSLEVRPGEVIGLVGENGAGKSTLMKILGGVITPDTGTITVDGVAHDGLTVEASIGSGIAFVHQELNLFENLDVAANIFFGREPLRAGPLRLVDRTRLRMLAAPLLKRVGANFSADTPVSALSLAQQQMVEIAKALSIEARLVILDEPTSSLDAHTAGQLLAFVRRFVAGGKSCILISHVLGEVLGNADRIVVMRDGKVVASDAAKAFDRDRLVTTMGGAAAREKIAAEIATQKPETGPLRVRARPARQDDGNELVAHAGEIIGLAGLAGHGQTDLLLAIFAAAARVKTGIEVTAPVALVAGIRTPDMNNNIFSLSGGNQQKALFARALGSDARIVLMDDPMRGVDIGTKLEVYDLVREEAGRGRTFLWYT